MKPHRLPQLMPILLSMALVAVACGPTAGPATQPATASPVPTPPPAETPAAQGALGEQPRVVPLLRDRGLVDGNAAAYVGRDSTCRAPVTEPEEL